MKHGHKTETVTAKVKKASGGKSSVATGSRSSGKGAETAGKGSAKGSAKGSVKAPRAKAGSKAAPLPEGKDGFSSEDVAAAYARAIEKYAVAFKRVTD